ncbi:MAG: 4,5-dihydroxyphthalate decarboxylase [Arthrobacter sp.]|jgi:4,5-dihydroxyphthalate decarboxylase|nr:4,5-dihydroxyphthalate decarboxylase [Arthrobacter sp.]
MAATTLTTVTRTQGNNEALKDGTVRPSGFALQFEEVPVLVQAFGRMVRTLEFDVSEMSATTYLCAKAQGVPFTALPVFLVRGFHHGAILVNSKSGISHPKDLEGRRVGVNRGYTVTTGVWARGILQSEYGVDLERIHWIRSAREHVNDFVLPPNVSTLEAGKDLGEMLIAGEIDAVIGVAVNHPDVVPLFPDALQRGYDALCRTGSYPINHLVVVKDEILERFPGVAAELFSAFSRSKELYLERLRTDTIGTASPTDQMYRKVLQLTGADPLPYGVERNRQALETLMSYAMDQHIIDKPTPIAGLFAETTRELIG